MFSSGIKFLNCSSIWKNDEKLIKIQVDVPAIIPLSL